MNKGTKCRITITTSILASSPKKGPQRFRSGQVVEGLFETRTKDKAMCFWVNQVDDFVFFPENAIRYLELSK